LENIPLGAAHVPNRYLARGGTLPNQVWNTVLIYIGDGRDAPAGLGLTRRIDPGQIADLVSAY